MAKAKKRSASPSRRARRRSASPARKEVKKRKNKGQKGKRAKTQPTSAPFLKRKKTARRRTKPRGLADNDYYVAKRIPRGKGGGKPRRRCGPIVGNIHVTAPDGGPLGSSHCM
jgi:hypothetical protein